MKIKVEHMPCDENEIILRCSHLDDEMLQVLSLLKERNMKIPAQKDDETIMINPSEIYYAESIEGKTFLYMRQAVMEAKESLTDLESRYSNTGLIRISKSMLVNLYRVQKMKSLINSRIEITIDNGERLIVSRHYIQGLKKRLGII